MEHLKELLAEIIVYRTNFKICHYTATGKRFQRTHDQADAYAKWMVELEDEIAERYGRVSKTFVGASDAVNILHASKNKHLVLGEDISTTMYGQLIANSQEMFMRMMDTIIATLESDDMKMPHNVGIKSYLEGLYDALDKEVRYLNTRRAIPEEE